MITFKKFIDLNALARVKLSIADEYQTHLK